MAGKGKTSKGSSAKQRIADTVESLIAGKITEMGYYLWDVEYIKNGVEYDLVVTIDRPEGIDLNDCEAVTRAIDPILDEADPIQDSYYLEVSSAGLEKDLKRPEHFELCRGQAVRAGLFAPLENAAPEFLGQKTVEGILEEYADGSVTISSGEKKLSLELAKIAYIRTIMSE